MRTFFLLIALTLLSMAQDREVVQRRAVWPVPVLLAYTGTDYAAGIAQTPQGYALPLYVASLPVGSRVSLYGYSLVNSSGIVLLRHSDGVVTVPATMARNFFPGIESITFQLPEFVTGEVWVTITGRQSSNSVRLFVEE